MTTDKLERQRLHFNRIGERYGAARRERNHLTLKRLMWRAFFADKRDLAGRRLDVLEPMCGFADGHEILATHLGAELDYAGFDYSDRVINSLRAARPELDVVVADVTRHRPEPASVDVVILLGGLHHVPDHAEAVVRTMTGALRPDGYFISLEPTQGNPLFGAVRRLIYGANDIFDAQSERAFDLPRLYALFEDAGLRLVDRMHPGLLSYVMYYNPDAFPFLNIGGPGWVEALFRLDRPFLRSRLGAWLSFATLTMWRRPPAGGGQEISLDAS